MPTYDPTSHPRLSAAAAALSPEVLVAYADEAEALLGLSDTAYTGADAERLTLAVALQVNHAVALEGYGGGLLQSERVGDQSYTVRTDARTGAVDPVSPAALALVHGVVGVVWPAAGSLR